MRPKTIILMLVAVACGLVAAFLASQYQGKESASNLKNVLVAVNDIPTNTKLSNPEQQLTFKGFPPDSVPPVAMDKMEDVRNKVVGRTIAKGTMVTSDAFSLAEDLFKNLPPGYRAIAISVDNLKSVAGFCLPGMRVDLMLTYSDPKTRQQVTSTFFENVLILAVNTLKDQAAAKDTGVIPTASTFTLAVKPEEAQRIILAGARGSISVALRRPGEDAPTKPKPSSEVFEGGDGLGPNAKDSATVKVWVARTTLLPGKDVDKTDFEAIPYPQSLAQAQNALTEREEIKGTLRHLVAAGHTLSRAHFQNVPADKPDSRKAVVTFLRIQEGSKLQQRFRFEDGQSVDDSKDKDRDNDTPSTPPKPTNAGKPSEGATEK